MGWGRSAASPPPPSPASRKSLSTHWTLGAGKDLGSPSPQAPRYNLLWTVQSNVHAALRESPGNKAVPLAAGPDARPHPDPSGLSGARGGSHQGADAGGPDVGSDSCTSAKSPGLPGLCSRQRWDTSGQAPSASCIPQLATPPAHSGGKCGGRRLWPWAASGWARGQAPPAFPSIMASPL